MAENTMPLNCYLIHSPLAKIRLKKIPIPITIVWMEGYICVKWNLRWSAPAF